MFPLDALKKVVAFGKGNFPTTLEGYLDLIVAMTELIRFGAGQVADGVTAMAVMPRAEALALMEAVANGDSVAQAAFPWQAILPVLTDLLTEIIRRRLGLPAA